MNSKPYIELVHEMMEKGPSYGAGNNELTPSVIAYMNKEISKVKLKYANSIDKILETNQEDKIRDALYDINTLVSGNEVKGIPSTKLERAISAFLGLEAEVFNGGFHQYFFNSAGDDWELLFDLVGKYGDSDSLRRFAEVINLFAPDKPSKDREKRWEQLKALEQKNPEEMWNRFSKLNDAFYDTPFPNINSFWNFVKSNRVALQINFDPVSSVNNCYTEKKSNGIISKLVNIFKNFQNARQKTKGKNRRQPPKKE
jgi:hypothetical protein